MTAAADGHGDVPRGRGGGRYEGRRQVAPELVPVLGEAQHVRIPRDFPDLLAGELTTWALINWHTGRADTTDVSQATLQAGMGRDGHEPSQVRKYLRRLEDVSLIETTRIHRADHTRNRYRPLRRVSEADPTRRWVELPKRLLLALAADDAGPEHVLAARRWLTVCAEWGTGWRDEPLKHFAEKWGQSVRTVRRHRAVLATLGVLDVLDVPGRRSLTALPGKLPAGEDDDLAGDGAQLGGCHAGGGVGDDQALGTAAGGVASEDASEPAPVAVIHSPADVDPNAADPRTPIPPDPGHEVKITPDTDPRGSTWCFPLPDENPLHSVPSGTVTAVDARARVEAAPAQPAEIDSEPRRPRRGARSCVTPSRSAWDALVGFPRAWHDGTPRWVARRLAEQIDRAMVCQIAYRETGSQHRCGVGPDAVVAAVRRYAPTPTTAPGGLGERGTVRHTRGLAAVLAMLAADVAAGACRDCGRDDDGRPHPRCRPRCAASHPGQPDHRAPAANGATPPATSATSAVETTTDVSAALVNLAPNVCAVCERADAGATMRAELPLPMPVCPTCWHELADTADQTPADTSAEAPIDILPMPDAADAVRLLDIPA